MAVTDRRGCVGTGLFRFHTLPAAKANFGYMKKGSYLVTWQDLIGEVRFSGLRGLPFMAKLVHSFSRVWRKEVRFWMCCERKQIPTVLVSCAFHLWHLNALRPLITFINFSHCTLPIQNLLSFSFTCALYAPKCPFFHASSSDIYSDTFQ